MSQIAEWLRRACAELGVGAELGFKLTLDDGRELEAIARIPNLGAPKGMLLVTSYDQISDYAQQLLDVGYGYSVLDEPGPDEQFDIDSFRDMFADWGWSGELACKPAWMQ